MHVMLALWTRLQSSICQSSTVVTSPAVAVPSFNVINGGSHAGNRLACQEFMILPVGALRGWGVLCGGRRPCAGVASLWEVSCRRTLLADEGDSAPLAQGLRGIHLTEGSDGHAAVALQSTPSQAANVRGTCVRTALSSHLKWVKARGGGFGVCSDDRRGIHLPIHPSLGPCVFP
eukprot:8953602-Alexandrium_andersonii.AAC.1